MKTLKFLNVLAIVLAITLVSCKKSDSVGQEATPPPVPFNLVSAIQIIDFAANDELKAIADITFEYTTLDGKVTTNPMFGKHQSLTLPWTKTDKEPGELILKGKVALKKGFVPVKDKKYIITYGGLLELIIINSEGKTKHALNVFGDENGETLGAELEKYINEELNATIGFKIVKKDEVYEIIDLKK